jgi:membrane-associated protease RseP (regulator of RpoE activity)
LYLEAHGDHIQPLDLASDLAVAGVIRASRQPVTRSIWILFAMAVLAVAAPSTQAQPADGDPSPRRGWLGLAGEDPESGAGSQGVIVVDVLPGSPAASAGLRAGDQIGAVNGRPIGTYLELTRRVAVLPPGTALRLSVRRGNRVRDVVVTLGKPPAHIGSTNGARDRPAAPAPVRSSGSSDSGQWHCRAVGTYAPPSMYAHGPDYSRPQKIDVTNDGKTRDAAITAALEVCGGLLTNKLLVMPDSLVLDQCKVIRCSR